MNHKNILNLFLLGTGLLLAPLIFAQAESSATKPATETEKTGSVETEYNDDNYRRFMELKDQPGKTSSLPTNSYKSGTEKLDELPAASQKHLRNQLREIILESDAWAPGDKNSEYPYIASEAAEQNTALQQLELEAWNELVGKYHEREARIYANDARSNSAAGKAGEAANPAKAQADTGESNSNDGTGSGQNGEGQSAQQGQTAGSQTAANDSARPEASSSTAAGASDPNAISTAGVSQSALEYLLGNTQQKNQQPGEHADPGQTENPSQQAATESLNTQQTMAQQQAVQQNSNEFVIISKGTLSIKELQNARGITISTDNKASQSAPGIIQEAPLRKDDDG